MSLVDRFPHNFFISCAGLDKEILRKLPDSETIKHTKTGILLLFTGTFAAFGGGYFYYLIFGNQFVSIILGILWGVFFFVLDRAIVSDTKVTLVHESKKNLGIEDKEFSWGNFFKDLFPILIRVMVALISAMIVSKSIELRIFKNSIERRITQERIDDNKQHDNLIISYKGAAKTDINEAKSVLVDKYNSEPQEAINKRQELDVCMKEYDNMKLQEESNLRFIKDKLETIKSMFALAEDAYKNPDYQEYKRKIEDINSRLGKKRKDCNAIANKINEILDDWREKERIDRDKYNLKEKEITNDLKEREDKANALRAAEINKDTLDELLPRQYLALDEIQSKEPALGQLGTWLFLLFLGIELSAILRKILMPKSSYDYALESQENRIILDLKSEEQMLKRKYENNQKLYDETLSMAEIDEARMKIKKDLDYKQGISHVKEALDNFHDDLSQVEEDFYNAKFERINDLEKALSQDPKMVKYLKSAIESYDDLQLKSKNKLFNNFINSFLKE